MGGEIGGIGRVVDEFAHPVVDVVGEFIIEVVRLKGVAQVHLPVGYLQQLVQTFTGAGGDGDYRHAQFPGQSLEVDFVAVGVDLIHKVQSQHHGALQLQQLYGEVEVSFQIGGVHNVDDGVRAFADDKVPGHDFLHGVGRQGVDAGQVHHGQFPVAQMGDALFFLHGHSGPVAHVLVGTGEGIKQGGLAAVGVARQSHFHGAVVVGVVVIVPAVMFQLVDVIPQLTADGLRVLAAV